MQFSLRFARFPLTQTRCLSMCLTEMITSREATLKTLTTQTTSTEPGITSTESEGNWWRHTFVFKTLISAFVLSRIDYCNSLLAGCPKQLIRKLQKLQNIAASLIYRTPWSGPISPVLHTLHLLLVEQRIQYKLRLLAFKFVNNEGPSYLSDPWSSTFLPNSFVLPLTPVPSVFLHSVWNHLDNLKITYQHSDLWNSLPYSRRHSNSTSVLKSALKTTLFPP